MKKKICMIVPSFSAKGGIATVVNGYKGSELEKKYDIKYIETYCDGNKVKKIFKAINAYFLFLKEILINKQFEQVSFCAPLPFHAYINDITRQTARPDSRGCVSTHPEITDSGGISASSS